MAIKALIIALSLLPSNLVAASGVEHPATPWRRSLEKHDLPHPYAINATNSTNLPSVAPANGTSSTPDALKQAEDFLSKIIAQQSAYNTYRVANPRRNTYSSRSPQGKILQRDPDDAPKAPVLNETILAAAALIAERDAARDLANGTAQAKLHKNKARQSGTYWVSELSGNGLAPMNSNPNYQVFRDVTDPKFGAKGDGVTDDTNAINAAIAYDDNCGSGCESSSIKGTLIYFPPGTYLISSPINAYYYSQLVGDYNDRPTIKTSASFVGLGAIQTDVYNPGGNGGEWYIEQSNFYRQVRNFEIDITSTTTANAAAFHWQVAQATSLTNVYISASTQSGDGNTQMGMFTENGSGGFMSDVVINGGAYGIYGGNQQYTVRNFIIWNQSKACICLLWDWGWTWSGLNLAGAPIGISLINPQGTSGTVAGSIYVLDSEFTNLGHGIYGNFNQSGLNSSTITLDNIAVDNVGTMLEYSSGATVDIPAGNIDFIVVGEIIDQGSADGSFAYNAPVRPEALVGSSSIVQNNYFTRSRPQYANISTDSIISVKSVGAYGDGVHDDTAAVQKALNEATVNNLIYFPAGSYLISETLFVWPFTRMTGEVWSQLVATGSTFANITSPQPMLRVGVPGNVGTVEISDMLFTSTGALPGLILIEWNVQAETQGSVGIWDSHFRLGGAYGTELQVAQCPLQGALKPQCIAAAMMLHITPEANGYFENMWAWVADHDIDDPQNTMISVQAARGILIESAGPTWLYGTASEHSMLYQYNFANSTNTFAGMIQTESPYFQGVSTGTSPGVWAYNIGQFSLDPTFFDDSTCNGTALQCEFAWALLMQSSTNLTIAGAGLYSWFSDYGQSCVDSQNCQQRIAYDDGSNGGLQLWNLITIGSVEMISAPDIGIAVSAKEFTQATGHPYWSDIAGYLESNEQVVYSCAYNDTRPYCQAESLCNLNQTFDSISALQSAVSSISNECVDYLAMNTLYNVFGGAIANYSTVNDGYDAVFGYYEEYMKEFIPNTITTFMGPKSNSNPLAGIGNQFFECACTRGCGDTSYKACPPNIGNVADGITINYKLTNESGYNATLQANGIDPSWVYLGTNELRTQTGCHKGQNYCVITDVKYVGIPKGTGNYIITNPKNYVVSVVDNSTQLMDSLLAASMTLSLGGWNGSADDMLQVYSTPVFLLQQSIASMASAKALGQQQEKEDKIKLITEIIAGILAAMPLVAELVPEAYAGIGAVLNFVTLAGGAGLTIEGIVENPGSALDTVLSLVGGAGFLGGFADEEAVAEGAATRRIITDNGEGASIGEEFASADAEFQDTIRMNCVI